VGLLLLEGALRLILFVDVPGLRRVTIRLRQPNNYFSKSDPEWWTTSVRFTPPERLKPIPAYDPLLGWSGSQVTPGTYAHANESLLFDRRPVLLCGDSFAECVTPPQECWQGLLQRSELGRTHLLLNYGVGGYGMDQSILMLRAAVERHRERDPIVILSVLVDDDLDRMLLPFRGWPKPRFEVRNGSLVAPAPVPEGVQRYLDEEAPFVWSWAWRYVRRATGGAAPDESAKRREIEELSRLLLASLKLDLDARGVTWFVLLFQGESILDAQARTSVWQYGFLRETLGELGVPFVTVRREIATYAGTPGSRPRALFEQEGSGRGHYSALGNSVVFPAILRGIRGELDR